MATTLEQVQTALASGYPLIIVHSPEEERIEHLLKRFAVGAKPQPLPLTRWSCLEPFPERPDSSDPLAALRWVAEEAPPGFYLFKDLHTYVHGERQLLRRLRDTVAAIRNTGRFVFMLSSDFQVPEELKPLSYVVSSPFPDESEVGSVVQAVFQRSQRSLDEATLESLTASLRGMSLLEVEHLLHRLLPRYPELGEPFMREVLAEKEQVMRKEGILEFVPPDRGIEDLGGLDQLKRWAWERARLFTPEARAKGLPRPRGVLLMGMSGCGKSLAVKVIANNWRLPLFRLDMNLVFAGVLGAPEWVFNRALAAVEAVSPATLWIDEIEMGVAGYQEGQAGSLTRIFSSFLTWMQEHRSDVFVAATANRINLLPAEGIRKGRFDQVFFLELPTEEERKEILSIHLRRQGLDAAKYDLVLLASAARGWNGAEIEQAVISARITCNAEERPVEERDLLTAMGKLVPLSTTMSEQIKAIRSWARTRAMPATTPERPEM